MNRLSPSILAIAFLAASGIATAQNLPREVQGDVLLIERVQEEPGNLPRRGMSMAQVEARFGAPSDRLDPRGGQKFFGAYGATKAGQIALVRSWQQETRKIGPRVLIETPCPLPTATRARFFPGEDRDALGDLHAEATRIVGLV